MADIGFSPVITPIGGDSDKTEGAYIYAHDFATIVPTNTIEVEIETIVEIERQITYYKRGYYVTGATFEFWQTTDPTGTNPSGNPLTGISIIATR